MKLFIKKLSFITIFIGIVFGILGLTDTYFNQQTDLAENKLNTGTLEIDLRDAFGSEIVVQFNVGPMMPYKEETSYAKIKNSGSLPLLWTLDLEKGEESCPIENKCLSNILQGGAYREQTLLDYLREAQRAENDQDYQEALDEFVKKVKFLEQTGLMSEEIMKNLIVKSKMIR